MSTYQVGDSPKFSIEIRNTAGVLADPTVIVIYIRKPDGSLSVNGTAMTKTETGKYYYDHTIDSQVGTHYLKIKSTGADGRVSIQPDSFKVVESFEV